MNSLSGLADAKRTASALGMTLGSLYRLAKAGHVPSYKVGPKLSGVRFDIEEVRQALRRPVRDGASVEAPDVPALQ